MHQTQRKSITKEQWDRAAEAYELGFTDGVDIAAELGVSPSTVSREFKRRGCRKGSRAMETVAELEAELDAKARRRAAIEQARQEAAAIRSAELDALMDQLVHSIIAASKTDSLAGANSTISEVRKALGMKGLR